jgi:hypothetical protein
MSGLRSVAIRYWRMSLTFPLPRESFRVAQRVLIKNIKRKPLENEWFICVL